MTKRKPKHLHEPMGRPTTYKPEYCQMLIEHMKKGFSFKSFAADVDCHYDTLYAWKEAHPDFSEAKKIGEAKSLKHWEQIGQMMVLGQLKTIKSERPMLNANGEPVLDPNTGQVLMERDYDQSKTSTGVYAMSMRNMHNWHDNRTIAISGDGAGAPIKVQAVERRPIEDIKEIIEVQKVLKQIEDAGKQLDDIEIVD
jgi:hypothetical protein